MRCIVKFLKFVADTNFRDTRVTSAIDAIWVLLVAFLDKRQSPDGSDGSHLDNKRVSSGAIADLEEALDQAAAVSVLHGLLISFTHEGFKISDKESRNGVLTVLTLIAESPSSHDYFIDSGLLNDLLYITCYAECSLMGSTFSEWINQHPPSSSNPRNFGTSSEHDLIFKRGLWILVSTLLQHDILKSLKVVGTSPFLLSLLLYTEYDTLSTKEQKRNNEVHRGTLAQTTLKTSLEEGTSAEFGCYPLPKNKK